MKVVVVGPTYMDCTIRVHSIPEKLDTSVAAEEVTWIPGGTGLSYAVALAHLLGQSVRLVTSLGTGPFTDNLLSFAGRNGVEVAAQHFGDVDSDVALVLVTRDGGKLAISNRVVTPKFRVDAATRAAICEADVLVVTSFASEVVREAISAARPETTILFAPNLKLAQNAAPLRSVLQSGLINIISAAADEVEALGASTGVGFEAVEVVAATRGGAGHGLLRYGSPHAEYGPFPCHVLNPLDTNGAGEAFGSAFLAAWVNEMDYNSASKVAGAYAVEHITSNHRQVSLFPRLTLSELCERV